MTWTTTGPYPRSAQWATLAPVNLSGGDVDFVVKVSDATPVYVVDANPLKVPPTPIEEP